MKRVVGGHRLRPASRAEPLSRCGAAEHRGSGVTLQTSHRHNLRLRHRSPLLPTPPGRYSYRPRHCAATGAQTTYGSQTRPASSGSAFVPVDPQCRRSSSGCRHRALMASPCVSSRRLVRHGSGHDWSRRAAPRTSPESRPDGRRFFTRHRLCCTAVSSHRDPEQGELRVSDSSVRAQISPVSSALMTLDFGHRAINTILRCRGVYWPERAFQNARSLAFLTDGTLETGVDV